MCLGSQSERTVEMKSLESYCFTLRVVRDRSCLEKTLTWSFSETIIVLDIWNLRAGR